MSSKQNDTFSDSTTLDTVQSKQFNRTASIKIIFYFVLTAIAVLAFSPNYNALPSFVALIGQLNHTIAFMVLFLLLSQAYPLKSTRSVFIILFGNALWIEAVQYFLPTRSTDWRDIAADSAGMFIGYLLIYFFRRLHSTKIPLESNEFIIQ